MKQIGSSTWGDIFSIVYVGKAENLMEFLGGLCGMNNKRKSSEIVDNYWEHKFHYKYDEKCSECYKNVKKFDDELEEDLLKAKQDPFACDRANDTYYDR